MPAPAPISAAAPSISAEGGTRKGMQKPGHRYGWKSCSCLGAIGIMLLLALLVVAYLLSESGLVRVPLFSAMYRGPVPARRIDAVPRPPDILLARISNDAALAVRRGSAPPYRIPLSEQDLSSALSGTLQERESDIGVTVRHAQIAIQPDGLELSGTFIRNGLTFDILMRVAADIHQGVLRLSPERAELGDLRVPSGILTAAMDGLVGRDVLTWELSVGQLRMEALDLREGELILLVAPKGGSSTGNR